MFPEFAYSPTMQIILAVFVFILTFFTLYLIAELILTFCETEASVKQKSLFAFISGTLLHNVWIYSVYFIGGMASFTPMIFTLITTPNPIWAVIYYYTALKIFKLPPIRSINIVSYVYMYWMLNKTLNRLIGALFFVQGTPYNYLLDAIQQAVTFITFFILSMFIKHMITKYHAYLKFIDTGFFNKRFELSKFFLNATFIYVIMVIATSYIPDTIIQNVLLNIVLIIFIGASIFYDLYAYNKQIISNQEVHINALFKGMEEFREVKHDFYNILHTYSGYMELGMYDKLKEYHASLINTTLHAGTSLDLISRMSENPALISLLISKQEFAEENNIDFMISLKSDITDFHIDQLDFSRVMTCVLNNAFEAASESAAKKVFFTCETKKESDSQLIIITNSTKDIVDVETIEQFGVTTKKDHSGIGLHTVRKTLSVYENCVFHFNYYNYEFSFYLEIFNQN